MQVGRLSNQPYDIVMTPGPGGFITMQSNDCQELIRIGDDQTITILGETFSLELIRDALKSFRSDACRCEMRTLMMKGCQCGGK